MEKNLEPSHFSNFVKEKITVGSNNTYNRDFYKDLIEESNLYSAEQIISVVVNTLNLTIDSAVDVGCGSGTWLNVLKKQEKLKNIKGIDGQWVDRNFLIIPDEDFIEADLSTTLLKFSYKFDLAISLEVAEHLAPERAEAFIDYLTDLSDLVLFSAAIPFQGGTNHLNERWPNYWAELFEKHEFVPLDIIRPEIWNDQKIRIPYRQNTILYVHKNKISELDIPYGLSGKPILPLVYPDVYLKFADPTIKRLFWKGVVRRALIKSVKRIFRRSVK